MEISQGRKLCHAQSRNREDRISGLPDAILHQILAHFPTDQVVRFSLLSTRWKYLWTSIPILAFSYRTSYLEPLSVSYCETPERLRNFQNFVDSVLSHHEMSNIHKFSLWEHSPVHLCGSCFETWISILSRHKLGELVLRVDAYDFNFPNFLSIFKSLTVLRIYINSVLCVPGSICFPNLKNLHFEKVEFSCDKSIQQVSFTFPVLEELTVDDWDWLEIKYVNIYAPALKNCILDGEEYRNFYETEIKIDAMNLIVLSIKGFVMHDYSLSYLPSLVETSVDVIGDYDNQGLAKFVARLNHVKNLTLSNNCIQNLFGADFLNNMQIFANLICLSVNGTYKSENFSAECLIALLCYTPNIECLYIKLDTDDYFYDDVVAEISWTHENIPQCSLLNLKSVEIMYSRGSTNELCLIAYLLVRTLEKMIISYNFWPDDPERKNAILKEILMLPRGSAGTEVIVT